MRIGFFLRVQVSFWRKIIVKNMPRNIKKAAAAAASADDIDKNNNDKDHDYDNITNDNVHHKESQQSLSQQQLLLVSNVFDNNKCKKILQLNDKVGRIRGPSLTVINTAATIFLQSLLQDSATIATIAATTSRKDTKDTASTTTTKKKKAATTSTASKKKNATAAAATTTTASSSAKNEDSKKHTTRSTSASSKSKLKSIPSSYNWNDYTTQIKKKNDEKEEEEDDDDGGDSIDDNNNSIVTINMESIQAAMKLKPELYDFLQQALEIEETKGNISTTNEKVFVPMKVKPKASPQTAPQSQPTTKTKEDRPQQPQDEVGSGNKRKKPPPLSAPAAAAAAATTTTKTASKSSKKPKLSNDVNNNINLEVATKEEDDPSNVMNISMYTLEQEIIEDDSDYDFD